MKLQDKQNNLELIIDDVLLNRIGQIGVKHFPNEFGGFLIGNYSDDFKIVYVTNYILPKKFRGSPYLFERDIEGLHDIFKSAFEDKNQYYIGEWHTHPNGATTYSATDLNAMIKTVECDTVQITNPILLILSISKIEINAFAFYRYSDKKLIRYE